MGKNVAVFVDVANIFYAAKAAGVDIDYVTLLKSATAGRDFVRAYAYTGLDPDNENQKNFHAFLARHGFKVVSKDIRKYGDGKMKANLDIELVVDLMKTARNLDVAVVVSGDGDFAPAIRAVQEMGVRVEVISFRGNTSSDLIDVADQFTDIGQIARVEKGSSRSGRRVADDDEDLSMTEVPDKQSEGREGSRRRGERGERGERGGRGRGGRGRDRERETEREEAPVAAGSRAGLVALPGERLSKAPAAGDGDDEEPVEADEVAQGDEEQGDVDADGRRRRRRRGGRGRGRGRGREEGVAAGGGGEDTERTPFDEPELPGPAPRGPRTTPFGSVWDSQLGTPAARSGGGDIEPLEDEDLDEPAIPEYLLAERRGRGRSGPGGQGGRGGRGRGGAYAAALDRERYGGRGTVSRYGETRGAPGGGRPDRRPGRPERPDRPDRVARDRGRSAEPWEEVPPELEELIRAQLGRPRDEGRPVAGQPSGADGEAEAPVAAEAEAAAPKRRTTRRTAATAEGETAEAEAAAPKRRTTRKTAATAEGETAEAEAAAPKRRTTRRTAATAEGETAEAEAAAPKRRTTRKTAATPEGESTEG